MNTQIEMARTIERIAGPLLTKMGHEGPAITKVTPLPGRNLNARIDVATGESLFVKVVRGLGSADRYRRSLSFYDSVDLAAGGLRTPALLDVETSTQATAHEFLPEGASFGETIRENRATSEQLAHAARTIAALHDMPLRAIETVERSLPALPPWGPNAMTLDLYDGSTIGQLEMWRIIQEDERLRVALDELVRAVPEAERVPTHGDLRADQLFMTDDGCWMLDWEEFRLGDAARDVGGMVGELFYHRMRHLLQDIDGDVTDAAILARGAELIDLVVPDIRTFWAAYLNARIQKQDAAFADRAVGFVGWQLFDRALASATYYGRISSLDRALAGIGREAVCGGGAYAAVLGMDAA